MDVLTTLSRQRLLRAFAALQRQKWLEQGERLGWPLPEELSVHLQLHRWGLLG